MDVHDRLGIGPRFEANTMKHRETVDDDPAADQRGNQPADHGDSMDQPAALQVKSWSADPGLADVRVIVMTMK